MSFPFVISADNQQGGERITEKAKSWVKAEDVARLAGVTRSAVSRTFTPGASVAELNRAKVMRAAKKLGDQVNIIACTMNTGSSNCQGGHSH